MSKFPTPWKVSCIDEVVSADGEIVMTDDIHDVAFYIELDDLVARMNAGAEAIERLAFMTKVAEQAISGAQIGLDKAERKGFYALNEAWSGNCFDELTAFLEEWEK